MQPNGNMPGAAQPASPVRPVAPVGPTKPVNPAASVKPAAPAGGPTFDNGPSVVDGKGNKKTGWILAVVLLLIVAIGGVGFGVWTMMDGNAQKDALNSQISALKQQNNDLQDKLDNGGGTIINIDADGNEVNTADYIYVGEWGLKFKIPENLEKVSYKVDSWDTANSAGTGLCVSGATTGHGDGIPTFLNPSTDNYNNYLRVCINKNTRSTNEEDGGFMNETVPVGQFYIVGPQAIIGNGTDSDWEVESADVIRAMLEDESNRSAI